MKNILIMQQKGGVGKSTCADLLAFSLDGKDRKNSRSEAADAIPYNFYDVDAQGGVLHETIEKEAAVVSIIDTPGSLQSKMRSWIQEVEKTGGCIIIPTKASIFDQQALQTMIDMVKDVSVPVVYVICIWNRYTTASYFEDWLKEATEGEAAIIHIPQSELIMQSAMMGMYVRDYAPKAPVSDAVRDFVNYIRGLLNLPLE